MKTFKLNNGIEIPALGYGVFQITDAAECEQCVYDAIMAGYRLIDTAAAYMNEGAVGRAIKRSGVLRGDLFITTKLWIQDCGYEETKKAFYLSLKRLDLEYIDLYLIHQPVGDYYGAWRAMEELYHEGKIRAIGVCNFSSERLVDLILHNKVAPAVNQVEVHPFRQQVEEKKLMEEYKVQIEAWGPFAEAQRGIFTNETLAEIAKKYEKTIAQIILRWHIQYGVVAIPKSVHKNRIQENFNIWDFELNSEDMEKIADINTEQGLFPAQGTYQSTIMLSRHKIHE